jgi:hypothetical protein
VGELTIEDFKEAVRKWKLLHINAIAAAQYNAGIADHNAMVAKREAYVAEHPRPPNEPLLNDPPGNTEQFTREPSIPVNFVTGIGDVFDHLPVDQRHQLQAVVEDELEVVEEELELLGPFDLPSINGPHRSRRFERWLEAA